MISLEEELEALTAMYNVSLESRAGSTIIYCHCLPRTADTESASFVSCTIEMVIPFDYPDHSHPIFSIVRTSGLLDEGRLILDNVAQSMIQLGVGENVLFNIIDTVTDCLDRSNDGECLVCAECLRPTDGLHRIEDFSVRTTCFHCFHLHCLVKWAAICVENRGSSKSAVLSRNKEDVELRAVEGEIRSQQQEFEQQQVLIDGLNESIAGISFQLRNKSDTDASNTSIVMITKFRTDLAELVGKYQKLPMGSQERNTISKAMQALRDQISSHEALIANGQAMASDNVTSADLDRCEAALAEAKGKQLRAVKR